MLTILLSILTCSLLLLFCGEASARVVIDKSKGDYVVLLHGLGRTAYSMKRLEWYFTSQGYQVINVTYRSRHCTMRQLSDVYLHQLLTRKILNQSARVHFVTHSMGGIILRQYLSNHYLENLGRVIMLAPPNHGSEIIDLLKSNPLTRSFLSLGGRELGTGINDVPQQLGPVQFECGVIACDRSLNPFLSYFLPGPNDGKVTVESAKIEGMRDFLLLHNTHTWLMWRKATLQQTRHFLEKGYFNRNFSDTIEKNCGN